MGFIRSVLWRATQLGVIALILYIVILVAGKPGAVEIPWDWSPPPQDAGPPVSPPHFTPPPDHHVTCGKGRVIISVRPDTPDMRDFADWRCHEVRESRIRVAPPT